MALGGLFNLMNPRFLSGGRGIMILCLWSSQEHPVRVLGTRLNSTQWSLSQSAVLGLGGGNPTLELLDRNGGN